MESQTFSFPTTQVSSIWNETKQDSDINVDQLLTNSTENVIKSGYVSAVNLLQSTSDPVPSFWRETDVWEDAKLMSYKIASPVILILGTAGNILTILVLRRLRSNTSTLPLFFTALAVSDFCLLYTGLLPLWVDLQFGYSILNASQVTCKMLYWLFYSFGTLSAWFLVAMTIQRAFGVVWPHKVRAACTKRHAHVIILVLMLCVLGMTSHLLYGLDTLTDYGGVCYFSDSYLSNFLDVWIWVDLMASSLLPFAVLLLSNSVLVWKVLQSLRRAKARLTGGHSEQVAARERKFSSLTVTLMSVSAAFVLLTGPVCVLSIVAYYLGQAAVDADQYPYLTLLSGLFNLLWYTNSTVNFFLYILTGTNFRQELKALVGLHGKALIDKRTGNKGDF